jgi:hypothetical protein
MKVFVILFIVLAVILPPVVHAQEGTPPKSSYVYWASDGSLTFSFPGMWAFDTSRKPIRVANTADALPRSAAELEPGQIAVNISITTLDELNLPGNAGLPDVAGALAPTASVELESVQLNGSEAVCAQWTDVDHQNMLFAWQVAPDTFAVIQASAAPGQEFPHESDLLTIARSLVYTPPEVQAAEGEVRRAAWYGGVQHRHLASAPYTTYAVVVPPTKPPAQGWRVVVTLNGGYTGIAYMDIVLSGGAILVVPDVQWLSFEDNTRIISAIWDELAAEYPLDEHGLVVHGVSVGGAFAQYYAEHAPEHVFAVIAEASSRVTMPPDTNRHLDYIFVYGSRDALYNAQNQQAIGAMQKAGFNASLDVVVNVDHTWNPYTVTRIVALVRIVK